MPGASLASLLPRVRTLVALSLAIAGLLMGAAPAEATRVDYLPDPRPNGISVLQIQGQPNEVNDAIVTFDPGRTTYTIHERRPGAIIFWVVTDPCQFVSPGIIECDGAAVTTIEVLLGDGDDTVTLDVPIRTLVNGGPGADAIAGGSGSDELNGFAGADAIDGREGDDVLRSDGETNDVLATEAGSLAGGPGNDFVFGTNGNETLDGGSGDDELRALGQDDTINGGDGEDLLSGGDGSDTMEGGGGNDEVGTIVTGSPGNRPLERGNDTMDGGPGDDLLRPGAGPTGGISDDDVLRGGEGQDTVRFERRTDPLLVTIDGISNDGQVGEADNIEPNIEKVVGGAGDDTLIGSSGNDTIDGAGGDDLIDGLQGNDLLEGGTEEGGSDHIRGGGDDDTLSGSGGDDFIDAGDGTDAAAAGEGSDFVDGGPGADRLAGDGGADTLNGGAANDQLDGGDGGDALDGGEGNDAVMGKLGNDTLRGALGRDDLSGGDGIDVADYELTAGVTVTLDDVAQDGSAGEDDNVRTDVENVEGGGDQDTFLGSGRGNTLDGASGEDYVDGAGGADELLGGGSIDVVRARDGSADTVDCGRARDLAVVDPSDKVTGTCERVDDGVGTRPTLGRDVVVEATGSSAGTSQSQEGEPVEFGLPGMRRTVPLKDRTEIPVRSTIDATHGPVEVVGAANGSRVAGAANGRNGRQTAIAEGSSFRVYQKPAKSPVLELRLSRLTRSDCHVSAGRKARTARHRKRRRLGTRARGRIRTTGNYGSGTSRGTSWVMEDGCEGTLFRVRSGTLTVTDFALGRRITLHAGDRYLAKARR